MPGTWTRPLTEVLIDDTLAVKETLNAFTRWPLMPAVLHGVLTQLLQGAEDSLTLLLTQRSNAWFRTGNPP